ncbi:hypothetical protein GAJ38_26600 [Escherichia coli]|nr:hypothetical protein [Escherichia coli]
MLNVQKFPISKLTPIVPAGDIADRFRSFVHDHPVVFLDPPVTTADNRADVTLPFFRK